jgi:hypothetical protein
MRDNCVRNEAGGSLGASLSLSKATGARSLLDRVPLTCSPSLLFCSPLVRCLRVLVGLQNRRCVARASFRLRRGLSHAPVLAKAGRTESSIPVGKFGNFGFHPSARNFRFDTRLLLAPRLRSPLCDSGGGSGRWHCAASHW